VAFQEYDAKNAPERWHFRSMMQKMHQNVRGVYSGKRSEIGKEGIILNERIRRMIRI